MKLLILTLELLISSSSFAAKSLTLEPFISASLARSIAMTHLSGNGNGSISITAGSSSSLKTLTLTSMSMTQNASHIVCETTDPLENIGHATCTIFDDYDRL